MFLLGVHSGMVPFGGELNPICQFWIHTESICRMPRWFEAVMNTPSHHRVHHGRNPRYLDSNYAGVFIVGNPDHRWQTAGRIAVPVRVAIRRHHQPVGAPPGSAWRGQVTR